MIFTQRISLLTLVQERELRQQQILSMQKLQWHELLTWIQMSLLHLMSLLYLRVLCSIFSMRFGPFLCRKMSFRSNLTLSRLKHSLSLLLFSSSSNTFQTTTSRLSMHTNAFSQLFMFHHLVLYYTCLNRLLVSVFLYLVQTFFAFSLFFCDNMLYFYYVTLNISFMISNMFFPLILYLI